MSRKIMRWSVVPNLRACQKEKEQMADSPFQTYCQRIEAEGRERLKTVASNEQLLELYKWFKQASMGDLDDEETPRPWFVLPLPENLAKAAKWDAWKSAAGTPSEEAEANYSKIAGKMLRKLDRLSCTCPSPDKCKKQKCKSCANWDTCCAKKAKSNEGKRKK